MSKLTSVCVHHLAMNVFYINVKLLKVLYLYYTDKIQESSTITDGWGRRVRTSKCLSQSQVPYRLAIPQSLIAYNIIARIIMFVNKKVGKIPKDIERSFHP